jgi:hypothetical protein
MLLSRVLRHTDWTKVTQFTGDAYLQSMMGHGLRATSQSDLTDKLLSRGFLALADSEQVAAFRAVDRSRFLPTGTVNPHNNEPKRLSGSHSMSTPQFHAQVLSVMSRFVGPGRTVAEIGCGSGYLPAVLSEMGCDRVIAVEREEGLLETARKNLVDRPNVTVTDSLPTDLHYDALLISPFLTDLKAITDRYRSSRLVFALRQAETDIDQQLFLMTHGQSIPLFRVCCEPLSP